MGLLFQFSFNCMYVYMYVFMYLYTCTIWWHFWCFWEIEGQYVKFSREHNKAPKPDYFFPGRKFIVLIVDSCPLRNLFSIFKVFILIFLFFFSLFMHWIHPQFHWIRMLGFYTQNYHFFFFDLIVFWNLNLDWMNFVY